YDVISAIIPAIRKEIGVPPFPKETAKPNTAKMPPPTIPPIPMEMASFNPIFFDFLM
ncbi:hypothetical protein MNBD_BACTEROID02-1485, partial [hydrothermal vent metagenome]